MVETPTQRTTNMYPQLDNVMQFRLERINKIKDKFIAEIYEKKAMNQTRYKYKAVFDYVGKALLVLSATSGGVSIAFLANVIGAPV